MSLRALVAVLVLFSAVVGGSAGIVGELLAPEAHGCGESCCCEGSAAAAMGAPGRAAPFPDGMGRMAPAGCCAGEAVPGPQLRASCGCGQHQQHATAPVLSPFALPGSSAAAVVAPPRLAAVAQPQRFPHTFPSAPDPPPPRGI